MDNHIPQSETHLANDTILTLNLPLLDESIAHLQPINEASIISQNERNGAAENNQTNAEGVKSFEKKHGEDPRRRKFWNRVKGFAGMGTYYWEGKLPGGTVYHGEWKDSKFDGYGVCWYKSGHKYEGEYKDGREHGYGVYLYQDGMKYEGDWKEGKKHGKGKFCTHDGMIYEGEWKDGQCQGYGVLLQDGSNFPGEFFDNLKHGSGVETLRDGTRSEGTFSMEMKHGYGTMVWPDSKRYEGQWNNDKQHGEGKEYLLANGIVKRGIWENGVHVKWLDEEDQKK